MQITVSRQDESRAISENSQWGLQRRFEQGKLQINTTKFLGYDKDDNGNLIINEEQAKVVKRIYSDYLNGKGPNRIAKELEEEGVKNWNGLTKWYVSTVSKILKNEKYKGDALLQKTYTVDFLSKKRATNNGEVPRYYVEDSHPGIIDKDMWEAVQLETERREAYAKKHGIIRLDYAKADNPLAGKVICGECGSLMGRKVWNSTDKKLRRVIWQCNHKYEVKGKVLCENRHVDGNLLQAGIRRALSQITENRESYRKKWGRGVQNQNPLKRHQAVQLLQFLVKIVEMENAEGEFSSIIGFVEVGLESLAVTLVDGTKIEMTIAK